VGSEEVLSLVLEMSRDPEDLTAGDVGVIASFLSDMPPNSLMNATVSSHI